MGKSKKKHSKKVNYVHVGKLCDLETSLKRSEIDATNNQKNIKQNQVKDKSECKESFAEGIRVNIKVESNELDSYERKEYITKKESFDQSRKELINEIEKKNPEECDTSESTNEVVLEINVDIFRLSEETSLACCVSEDFKMDSDIRIKFKNTFGDIDKLLEQNLIVGEVGVVNHHNQNAFYLVTKKYSHNKSKLGTIIKVFKNLIKKMEEMNLTKLAIAKTNFELEGPSWSDIKEKIKVICDSSNIHITVCDVPSKELEKQLTISEDSFNLNKKTHECKDSGFVNESSDQKDKDSNMKGVINNKKKKKNEDEHENNFDFNKSTKFCKKSEKKSSTNSQSCISTYPHDDWRSTDDDTSQEFKKNWSSNNKKSFKNKKNCLDDGHSIVSEDKCNLKEIDQDLFELPEEFSLAHCVAEDLRMGAGIAVEFKRKFGGVGKLIDQNLKVGSVGVVQRHNQNAFYLITKKFSNGKPTMHSMKMALLSLLTMMKNHGLMNLGIPKIGCGLDGLDWDNVKLLIMEIFDRSDINIVVCVPSKFLDRKAPPPLKVNITLKNLWEMESQTTIIMPIDLNQISKQNWSNNIIDEVNSKYPFKENLLEDVKKKLLSPGDILQYCVNNECLICVFFLRDNYYSCLEKAFKKILHSSKNYMYLAIQSGLVVDNFKQVSWIVLILRSISNNQQSELWLCGNTEQTDDVVMYDQYCRNSRSSMDHSTSRVIYKSSNDSYSAKEYSQNFRSSLPYNKTSNEAGLISSKKKKTYSDNYNMIRLVSLKEKQTCSTSFDASSWISHGEKQIQNKSFNEAGESSLEQKQNYSF